MLASGRPRGECAALGGRAGKTAGFVKSLIETGEGVGNIDQAGGWIGGLIGGARVTFEIGRKVGALGGSDFLEADDIGLEFEDGLDKKFAAVLPCFIFVVKQGGTNIGGHHSDARVCG